MDFWQAALGVAGIGAIGSFVIWSIYKQWLTLDVFQNMTKRQTFILFVIMLILTFLFALAALAAFVYVSPSKGNGNTNVDSSVQTYFPHWGEVNDYWPKYPGEVQTFADRQKRIVMQCAECLEFEDNTAVLEGELSNAEGSTFIVNSSGCTQGVRLAIMAFKRFPSSNAPPRVAPVYDALDVKPNSEISIRLDKTSNFQLSPVMCLNI